MWKSFVERVGGNLCFGFCATKHQITKQSMINYQTIAVFGPDESVCVPSTVSFSFSVSLTHKQTLFIE